MDSVINKLFQAEVRNVSDRQSFKEFLLLYYPLLVCLLFEIVIEIFE